MTFSISLPFSKREAFLHFPKKFKSLLHIVDPLQAFWQWTPINQSVATFLILIPSSNFMFPVFLDDILSVWKFAHQAKNICVYMTANSMLAYATLQRQDWMSTRRVCTQRFANSFRHYKKEQNLKWSLINDQWSLIIDHSPHSNFFCIHGTSLWLLRTIRRNRSWKSCKNI